MITHSEKELRVLHVEDNPDDVELFLRAIARACPGCHVQEVESTELALAALEQASAPPHVVITDSSFTGGITADEFIRTVRDRYPRIPVIALSAHNEPALVNRAYEAGVTAYFVKPATFDQLLRTVTVLTVFLELCELPS